MLQKQPNNSFRDSIKALEADIQHANTLASAVPRDYGGDYIQMKLSYSTFAPLFLSLIEWLDCSCTDDLPTYLGLLHILVFNVYVDGVPSISSKEKKATLREFYAVIYPSLRLLEGEFNVYRNKDQRSSCSQVVSRKRLEKFLHEEEEEEEEEDNECGICMENSRKMVLPNCGHSLCISCFHDWYLRSESCPFCRGSLKRVSPTDLWEVIGTNDVVDRATLAMENLRRFYHYMENLPHNMPDTHVFENNYML